MDSLREFFHRAYPAVLAAVQQQGTQLAGPPFALYRGTPSDVVDVEAGFPLAARYPGGGAGGVSAGLLPGGRALEAVHVGPYDTLPNTYRALTARMQADGLTPGESMWESYLTDPAADADPAGWRTLVVWPLA
jgi:AraC family transcriptional regulator